MRKFKLITLIILAGSLALAGVSHATDYYVAQNATGANSGVDSADAYSATWFNTASNWGSGAGKINPGDTVHICGTWTGAANSTLLTFQGSGTAGHVTTVLFEPGAVLQAPYFSTSGAISASNQSYIKIDGGTDGIIQNTSNGSAASGNSYSAASQGVYFTGCSNIEVANLTIKNIFINTGGNSSSSTDVSGDATSGIRVEGAPFCNVSIHNNTISSARAAISFSVDSSSTSSNINVYDNTTSDHCWGIQVGSGDTNVSANEINIYNNNITNWALWQFPTNTYHTDGIIVYSDGSGSDVTGSIYGNYIHGDLGSGSPTAFIFLESNTKNFNIYNNLTVASSGANAWIGIWSGGDTCTGGGHNIFNNTFVGSGSSGGALIKSCNTTGNNFENNIFANAYVGVMCRQGSYGCINSSNYNSFYTSEAVGNNDTAGPPAYLTLSAWQSGDSQDANSLTSNPLLTSTYTIPANSPAVDAGANLSTYFTTDMAGNARPQSGAWDLGAYQHASSADTTPPSVTGFIIPSTSSSLTVPITTFTATDNVGVTGYCVTTTNSSSGCSWSTSAPTSMTFASSGAQTAYAWAKDAAGNISTPVSATTTITLSSTPPTITAFTLPSTATSQTVPITSFTASDNVGIAGYCVSTSNSSTGCSWPSSAPTQVTFASTGTQTAYAWAKDASGNISSPKSASTTISVPVAVNGACGSANGETVASLSASSSNLCSPGTVASFSGTGPWTWGCNGSNGGTNTASNACSASLQATVTSSPTVTAFTLQKISSSLTVPITSFTATDNAGVTGYCVSTTNSSSGCSWTSSAPTSVKFGSTGTQTAYAWAKDAAGNISSSVSASTTISARSHTRR
jgi:hypothetical protein